MNINEKVAATYKVAVRREAAKVRHTTWGGKNSLAVVEDLVSLLQSDEEVDKEGFDAIREKVESVINPSAYAQVAETLPDGTGIDVEGKADTMTYDESLDKCRPLAKGESPVAHPAFIRRPKKGGRTTNRASDL